MKSHAELTKRQLQMFPYLLACPTYEAFAQDRTPGYPPVRPQVAITSRPNMSQTVGSFPGKKKLP